MSKARMGVLFIASVFMITLGFNNCSKVDFQKVDSELLATAQQAAADGDISEEEIQAIVEQLPEGEIDVLRPVTELENDPSLFDTYKCGDGGVLICHFPSNVVDSHSLCVGRSAVTTHYDHIRSYAVEGEQKEIGDYLGPCRFAL